VRIVNQSKNTVLADHIQVADTFLSRMTGLLKHSSLPEGTGLLITRCNSIHMFFMKFSIDAIFADRNHKVVGIVKKIEPFQLSKFFFRASYVVELPIGKIHFINPPSAMPAKFGRGQDRFPAINTFLFVQRRKFQI
jgi:uncharacterized membrane protein (UPF0127 family)